MGIVRTTVGVACLASGGVGLAGGGLNFEITCLQSHFLPFPLVEQVFPLDCCTIRQQPSDFFLLMQ